MATCNNRRFILTGGDDGRIIKSDVLTGKRVRRSASAHKDMHDSALTLLRPVYKFAVDGFGSIVTIYGGNDDDDEYNDEEDDIKVSDTFRRKSLTIWNCNFQLEGVMKHPNSAACCVAVAPNNVIVSEDDNRVVRIWVNDNYTKILEAPTINKSNEDEDDEDDASAISEEPEIPTMHALTFSPDGKWFATAGNYKIIRVYVASERAYVPLRTKTRSEVTSLFAQRAVIALIASSYS